MSQYYYEGVDRLGKEVKGNIQAVSEGEVRMTLRTLGIRPRKLQPGSDTGGPMQAIGSQGFFSKIPTKVVVPFTRQLQVLITSGIPLVQSIEILAEGTSDRKFRAILKEIQDKITQGAYLWEAMRQFPNAFPGIYVSLVRAGEASGAIEQILERLSKYMETNEKLKSMLKGAMIYPVAVTGVAIIVIGVMMVFVIPKFKEMLTQSGKELPGITAMVIDASNFFVNNIFTIVIGFAFAGFGFMRMASTPTGREAIDRAVFMMPLFGDIAKKGAIARFSRTLQTLLSSGVNLIEAIDICRSTVDNKVLEKMLSTVRGEIEQGKTLGSVIGRLDFFPKMSVHMMAVGEASGNLDTMLDKIADYYESEVEAITAGLSKLIEPFMIVFLGGIVAVILVALYLPIFQMAGSAGGG